MIKVCRKIYSGRKVWDNPRDAILVSDHVTTARFETEAALTDNVMNVCMFYMNTLFRKNEIATIFLNWISLGERDTNTTICNQLNDKRSALDKDRRKENHLKHTYAEYLTTLPDCA